LASSGGPRRALARRGGCDAKRLAERRCTSEVRLGSAQQLEDGRLPDRCPRGRVGWLAVDSAGAQGQDVGLTKPPVPASGSPMGEYARVSEVSQGAGADAQELGSLAWGQLACHSL